MLLLPVKSIFNVSFKYFLGYTCILFSTFCSTPPYFPRTLSSQNWGDGQTDVLRNARQALIPFGEHPLMHDGCIAGRGFWGQKAQ
jgi:hypothetical protein